MLQVSNIDCELNSMDFSEFHFIFLIELFCSSTCDVSKTGLVINFLLQETKVNAFGSIFLNAHNESYFLQSDQTTYQHRLHKNENRQKIQFAANGD